MTSGSSSARKIDSDYAHSREPYAWMQGMGEYLKRTFPESGRRLKPSMFVTIIRMKGGFPKSIGDLERFTEGLEHDPRTGTINVSHSDLRLMCHPTEDAYWDALETELGEEFLASNNRLYRLW